MNIENYDHDPYVVITADHWDDYLRHLSLAELGSIFLWMQQAMCGEDECDPISAAEMEARAGIYEHLTKCIKAYNHPSWKGDN